MQRQTVKIVYRERARDRYERESQQTYIILLDVDNDSTALDDILLCLPIVLAALHINTINNDILEYWAVRTQLGA